MKHCPTCNRTYEDALTFCLVDGAILSAPFDPQATLQMSAARPTDAPPTQALPSYSPSPPPPLPPIPSSQYLPLKFIVIAGVMVVLGAVILVLVLKKKTPTTSTTTTSTRPSSQTPQSSPATQSSPPTDLFTTTEIDAAQSSPTATYKAVYAAMKNKDAAAFKRAMTKKDLQTIEESAKAADQSSDEILKQVLSFTPLPSSDESRNEKIDGDEATLEVKNALDEWETVHFVREDGQWKMK